MNFLEAISDGTAAEEKARLLFKSKGYMTQKPDLIVGKGGKSFAVEVKDKAEPFKAPPFDGHGLDKSQIWLRTQLLEQAGLRTYLLVYESSGRIYGQFLDKLEQGRHFDTASGKIRVYPLENFNVHK